MLYRPSSFRKTAIALTTGAVLAATTAFPAAAQQTVNFSATPDCATIHDAGKRAVCESFKRTDAAKAQTQAEAVLRGCLVRIANFKKAQPDDFAKLGIVTRENACEIAGKLPRASASLN
ncbi:MAG: hypothetical protein QOJ96_1426 [Alphaproteobacteria bacterium]|jgi:hypothetical protein|nr:hypothetical protein [Alphaproteobacteria bacterium]